MRISRDIHHVPFIKLRYAKLAKLNLMGLQCNSQRSRRPAAKFIFFTPNVRPIKLPMMKITTIADKSIFGPEQKA